MIITRIIWQMMITKNFFYCNPKYSTPSKQYLGIVPELVEIRKYNKQLFDFLNSFIPVVEIMNNYLQQPLKEKWTKKNEKRSKYI